MRIGFNYVRDLGEDGRNAIVAERTSAAPTLLRQLPRPPPRRPHRPPCRSQPRHGRRFDGLGRRAASCFGAGRRIGTARDCGADPTPVRAKTQSRRAQLARARRFDITARVPNLRSLDRPPPHHFCRDRSTSSAPGRATTSIPFRAGESQGRRLVINRQGPSTREEDPFSSRSKTSSDRST